MMESWVETHLPADVPTVADFAIVPTLDLSAPPTTALCCLSADASRIRLAALCVSNVDRHRAAVNTITPWERSEHTTTCIFLTTLNQPRNSIKYDYAKLLNLQIISMFLKI